MTTSFEDFANFYDSQMGENGDINHKYSIDPALFELVDLANLSQIKSPKIYDIGTGNGYLARFFANFSSQVFASDISASLIKIAQEKNILDQNSENSDKINSISKNQKLVNPSSLSTTNSKKNSKNLINYFVYDGANFDNFEEKNFGTFDLIYANMSLHYIQNLVEFKRGILKLLKSGGKFVFTTSHPFSDLKLFSEKPKNQLTRAEMSQITSNYLKNQTVQTFFGDFPLIIHKRPISFYVNFFLGEFKLEKMREISKIQPKENSEKFLKNGEFNLNSENQIFDTGIPAYFGLSFVKL